MTSENLCNHYKFGFCKHGDHCRKRHIKEKCDEEHCDQRTCEKRHPLECRYFREYGRCKFGSYCLYDHVVKVDPKLQELQEIKDKIEAIEKKLDEKNKEIVDHLTRLENIISNYRATSMAEENNMVNSVSCLSSTSSSNFSKLKSSLIIVHPNSNTRDTLTNTGEMYHYQASPSNIPQMGGSKNLSQLNSFIMKEECENCHTKFVSTTELDQHNESYQFGCEDCGICFTTKEEYDFHELEKHPETGYARDIFPQATKVRFYGGLR